MDMNADGLVDAEEAEAAGFDLGTADVDEDGSMSFEEYQAIEEASAE